MNHTEYVFVSTTTRNPCSLHRDDCFSANSRWLCPKCHRPRRLAGPVDLAVQEDSPDAALSFVFGTGVSVAHRDFLSSLGRDVVERELFLGQLIDTDGVPFKDWVTFHGKNKIIVRREKGASYGVCDDCGQGYYCGTGEKYLYPEPPKGPIIFDDFSGGLVIASNVIERRRMRTWRRVLLDPLPVLAESLDGLGNLLV